MDAGGRAEALLLITKYGAGTDRYWEAFLKQWGFIERHLLDPEHGGWFVGTTREGKLLGDGRKATPWKANYHTSRAMMNVATLLGADGGGPGRESETSCPVTSGRPLAARIPPTQERVRLLRSRIRNIPGFAPVVR